MTPSQAVQEAIGDYLDTLPIRDGKPLMSEAQAEYVAALEEAVRICEAERWQPIETAPDADDPEDPFIWVWNARKGKVEQALPDGSFWRYEKRMGNPLSLTHWMSCAIPAPPPQDMKEET